MAGKIRSILSKIGRGVSGLFSKKPKVKPAKKTPIPKLSQAGYEQGRTLSSGMPFTPVVQGRLGLHLGDLDHPIPDYQLETPEFRYAIISAKDVYDFVHNGVGLYVHSSNVASVSYNIDKEKMNVAFLNGSVYEYSNVTEYEAYSFATAGSKGAFIWNHFRIRGTKKGHKKPYRRLA